MRACVLERLGRPPKEALTIHTDWPKPERKENEVLVKVAAAGVNPIGELERIAP